MIIITGASKGIGKYLFEYYLKKGFDVIGIYNSTKPNKNLDNYISLNICDEEAVAKFVSSYELNDITLINAAGITLAAIAHKMDILNFEKTLNVNVVGSFNMIKCLLPLMRDQNYGRIINISSIVPQIGTPGNVAYATSKSALWGMSKVIAIENANKGITSNCLNLGYCNAGMVDTIPQNILDLIIEKIPQKKLCDLYNISNAIDFLIASDYVTGTQIDINGGLH